MPCMDSSAVVLRPTPDTISSPLENGCLAFVSTDEIADGMNLICFRSVVVDPAALLAVVSLLFVLSVALDDVLHNTSFLVCRDQSSIIFCKSSRWAVALLILGQVAVEKSQLLRTNSSGILGHPSGSGYRTSVKKGLG